MALLLIGKPSCRIAFIYLITVIETTRFDLTANEYVLRAAGRPKYLNRLKAGVLGDGVNSLIAAVFNTFRTTFSQNNGVIQHFADQVATSALLHCRDSFLLGLFPILGAALMTIQNQSWAGATLVMFGTVAAAGIKIIANEKLDRHRIMTIAISLGLGLGGNGTGFIEEEAPS
ncbi:hypothetical protein OK016_15145 [Vibrio chagasii]|nr:hypothetical protein [Vibrio chagasii]